MEKAPKLPGIEPAHPDGPIHALTHGADLEHGKLRIELAKHFTRGADQRCGFDSRTYHDDHGVAGNLRHGKVDARANLLLETIVLHVTCDANHVDPWSVRPKTETQPFPNRVHSWPEAFREGLVDDDRSLAIGCAIL